MEPIKLMTQEELHKKADEIKQARALQQTEKTIEGAIQDMQKEMISNVSIEPGSEKGVLRKLNDAERAALTKVFSQQHQELKARRGPSAKRIKTEVYCTLQVEGTHNWPNCPFDEVEYLKVPHRHMFGIKAYVAVTHDDRDTEFIMLKHRIHQYVTEKYFDGQRQLCVFGAMSCEMLARELIDQFDLTKCEVNEDGENGAVLTVVPPASYVPPPRLKAGSLYDCSVKR